MERTESLSKTALRLNILTADTHMTESLMGMVTPFVDCIERMTTAFITTISACLAASEKMAMCMM
ncbi:MAG: hypothetical protein LUF89_08805 [Ruminococcus sp.]|nr:hypothetical protein [Ruminococcus sp.]